MIHNSTKNGYITLMGVMVVSAVGLSVAISLLVLGLGTSRTSFAIEQSYQAQGLANGCAEEALQLIYNAAAAGNFYGNVSDIQGPAMSVKGICFYSISSTGSSFTINSCGVTGDTTNVTNCATVVRAGSVIRRSQVQSTVVVAVVGPPIVAASVTISPGAWKDVSSF